MKLLAGLALAFPALLPGTSRPVAPPAADVVSGNGWYRAEIRRAPGFEGRKPEHSRWRVEVFPTGGSTREPVWSAPTTYDGGLSGDHYLLSDDGTTLVRVHVSYQDYKSVVSIVREGREVAGPSGSSFDIPPSAIERTRSGKRWLAPDGVPEGTGWLETDTGPRPVLALTLRDGHERLVDLTTGRVLTNESFRNLAAVEVSPLLPERLAEHVATPYVRRFDVPGRVRAGAPIPVVVFADHPTPGWRFEGFLLEQSGEAGRELSLTPRSRGPMDDLAAQQLDPFQPTAHLSGAPPGDYRVRVIGATSPEPTFAAMEVLPADHVLALRRTGGFAGLDETVDVFGRGAARVSRPGERPGLVRVPAEALARLAELIERLPRDGGGTTTKGAADLFLYTLTYWNGALEVQLAVDDGTADTTVREIATLVAALGG